MKLIPHYRRIFATRKEQGKPSGTTWLAEQLGLERQTVHNYVVGHVFPKADTLWTIADILECKVDDLYSKQE